MKTAFVLCLTSIVCLIPLVHGGEGKDEAKMMEGAWLPTVAELAGTKFPDEVRKSMKLVLKDGQYTVTVGKTTDQGTVKLDPTKNPKAMDITGTAGPNKGKTFLCIYELSKDNLKVCYDLSGNARPTEFKTKMNSSLFLVTYERGKP